jgi:alpha-ketoglutarate-dependent taurine dioxygenase
MAVVVPSLGLEDQPLERQRYVLFALGNLLGTPTATEPRDRRVLWDVKLRTTTSGQFATFSETDEEAEFHTDSAFMSDPEPIFFLYVVQAARCDGGMSYFANGRRVRDRLMRTSRGRDALDLLRRARVPFRIPPAFSRDPEIAEYSATTVFGERPLIRFRRDVILHALDANPASGNDEIRDAVSLVADAALSVKTSDCKLPTGAIAFVDNHNALHGRSRFTDGERHLIRVRVAA